MKGARAVHLLPRAGGHVQYNSRTHYCHEALCIRTLEVEYFGAMAAFGGILVIVHLSTDLNPAALASEPHSWGGGELGPEGLGSKGLKPGSAKGLLPK